jgi:hypothetical protein
MFMGMDITGRGKIKKKKRRRGDLSLLLLISFL